MGKGGGGGAPPPQNQTVTQTNLPEYARPYFENIMERAQAESYRPYTPYQAERIAGFAPGQVAAQQETFGMQTPGEFGVGTGLTGAGGLGALASGQQYMGMATSPAAQQAFMSPYMQNVVDVQRQEAIRSAQMGNLAQNLGAARQGTYGGARQLLAQTERERALGQQLGDIQSRGLQSAFEAAQKGLEAERAAELQRAQTLGQIGSQFGQLGVAQQSADIDRLKTLGAYGDLERAYAQQGIDARYADLMRGIEFPESQLEKLSGFIRGIPMTGSVTQTTTPPPSFASQLSGMGIAGLGLYNAMMGK
jgi:hypothetical protein